MDLQNSLNPEFYPHHRYSPLIIGQVAEHSHGGFSSIGSRTLLQELEQRRQAAFLHDNHLVPVTAVRERSQPSRSLNSNRQGPLVKRGDVGPNPSPNRIITRKPGQRELNTTTLTFGIEDTEQPLQVPEGSVEEERDLLKIGGTGHVDDAAEDVVGLALAS
ncbi:hypothetical protein ACJRO7_014662 [Eucalyptus globulus]|uniref:Uncharacterized protein n=1 Tax=Eucalyptus globulus TaxID=34317 RepID=A0ABD3L0X6_EUCGL